MPRLPRRLGSRLFDLAAALSLAVCVTTAGLWLRYVGRMFLFNWFFVATNPVGIVGESTRPTPPFPAFNLVAGEVFEWSTLHPRGPVRGPEYLTPPYMQWETQFRRLDRVREFRGFHYMYWSQIWLSVPENGHVLDQTEFFGYETRVGVPYWFVLACSAPLPLRWASRRARTRRRRRLGRCVACGYDLRATPDRCPECGHIPAAHEKTAA